MEVFGLRSKTFLISVQPPKDLDLVFHWVHVSRIIHLTQTDLINWLIKMTFEKYCSQMMLVNFDWDLDKNRLAGRK